MSGHNKWSQIKLKKAKTDAVKSRIFSRLVKLIGSEARAAKGNREAPALRAAIERARKENMPSEGIERAIKKATESGGVVLESILYEGYGPGGAAILVQALTDSRNRAGHDIKFIFSEHGGTLASPGAAAWAFARQLTTDLPAPGIARQAGNSQPTTRWQPATTVPLSDEDLQKLNKLVEALEAHEDVQEVFTNVE